MKRGRERLRLGLVLLLFGTWTLRWTTAQTATGVRLEHGPERTGALGGVVLLALWGLAATALLARGRGQRATGMTLTEIILAGAATAACAFGRHGGSLGLGAPFAGLLLLAALELGVRTRDAALAREVALLRGAAALLTALVMALDRSWIAAGLALWLAVSAMLGGTRGSAASASRLEGLSLLAAVAALLTPWLGRAGQGQPFGVYEGQYGWLVLSAALALLALRGVLSRPHEPA